MALGKEYGLRRVFKGRSRWITRRSVVAVAAVLLTGAQAQAALVPYSDGFEGPTLNSFWSTFTSSGSLALSNANPHSGSQSVRLSTVNTGLNKEVQLTHSFGETVLGTFSVWFFDSGADQSSHNYIKMYASNDGGDVAGLYVFDYNFFEGENFGVELPGGVGVDTGVKRSVGWHKLGLELAADSTRFFVNDNLVYTAPAVELDRITLTMHGPSWRPASTTYFDDFSFTPQEVPEPASLLLVVMGGVGLAVRSRRPSRTA